MQDLIEKLVEISIDEWYGNIDEYIFWLKNSKFKFSSGKEFSNLNYEM